MYDINFFKRSSDIKKKITGRLLSKKEADDISAELDILRDKNPFIYNIETTNYCNMKSFALIIYNHDVPSSCITSRGIVLLDLLCLLVCILLDMFLCLLNLLSFVMRRCSLLGEDVHH